MKPINLEQLDELAAGLDAGWDTAEPASAQTTPSQRPLSTPPSGADVDALDANWDIPGAAKAPGRAQSTARNTLPHPAPANGSAPRASAPLLVSKQERREAERKRLAHQAQKKSANKQQRKTERREQARRASEQRQAEQQALAERSASAPPKRAKAAKPAPKAGAPSPKRIAKQARREQPTPGPTNAVPASVASARPASARPASARPASARPAQDSALKKLIPLVAIALVVGGTLCFALLRAAGH